MHTGIRFLKQPSRNDKCGCYKQNQQEKKREKEKNSNAQ